MLIKLYKDNKCLRNAHSADHKTQADKRSAKIEIGIHFGLLGVFLLYFKDIFATFLHCNGKWDSSGDQHGLCIQAVCMGVKSVIHTYGPHIRVSKMIPT